MDDLLDYREQPRTTEEINNLEPNNLDKIIYQVCDNTPEPFCRLLKGYPQYVDVRITEYALGYVYTDTYITTTHPPYIMLSIQPKKDMPMYLIVYNKNNQPSELYKIKEITMEVIYDNGSLSKPSVVIKTSYEKTVELDWNKHGIFVISHKTHLDDIPPKITNIYIKPKHI